MASVSSISCTEETFDLKAMFSSELPLDHQQKKGKKEWKFVNILKNLQNLLMMQEKSANNL